MDRAVSWLTNGLALSPKLEAALLRNIEQRTKYGRIEPDGPVRLTRHQLSYAAKTNPNWFGLDLDGCDLETDEDDGEANSATAPIDFDAISVRIQQDFRGFSAAFPHETRALAYSLVQIAAENCEKLEARAPCDASRVKERREEISGGAVACALAPAHELLPSSMSHDIAASAPRTDEAELAHKVETSATKRYAPAVSLWVKENKAGKVTASGFLETDGRRFAVVFSPYDGGRERMAQNSSVDWLEQLDATCCAALREREQEGIGVASRATLSPLHDEKDTHAFKQPAVADHALVLAWEEGAPAFALLIDSDFEWHRFNFKQEAPDRFKGNLATA
jgi:hypothetical protein